MDDDGTNAILIIAMVALLGAMLMMTGLELFRYQSVLATQPIDIGHDNLASFIGKPVRMVLFTSPLAAVTAGNGETFAFEQAVFRTRSEETTGFLPEEGLVLTDHDRKLKVICKQINMDFCTLVFKGTVTEGTNMLPKQWQDERKHNVLYVAAALPASTLVTAIGTLNKQGDRYQLDPIVIPFNRDMIPIVSTLKTEAVLSIWMNQILLPLVLKCGLCLLALMVTGLIYHARQIKMGARDFH